MAKAHSTWTVSPHGPLSQLDDNLWRVEQALSNMPLSRVMAVVRAADGKLVIHNAIALDDPSMKALEALGEPAYLLVPNGFHRLDARIYKDRYPRLRVIAPRGSRAKVEEVVPVDATYEQFPGDESVRVETLDGVGEQEGVVVASGRDGVSLIFNDVIFNMPHPPGVQGMVVRMMGSSGGPRVTRVARFFLIKDRRALRTHLERLAGLPGLRRILVSHHEVIDQDPAAVLGRVAATL